MSRGVVFSYSFSIYCAAYHGIWCSVCCHIMIMYVKYEFVLGLISVGDFPSIYLRYNSQITKNNI